MIHKELYSVFKKGSKTYFYSSMFFPSEVKKDVFALYSFVRTADNYADSVPQDKKAFDNFKNKYLSAIKGGKVNDVVIDSFVELSNRKKFDKKWTRAFLNAMEKDFSKKEYFTLNQTEEYIHGSAEVIGLFMSKILGLDKKSFVFARKLGKAMQYINFIRDMEEDLLLGRKYFPKKDIISSGLVEFSKESAFRNPKAFKKFVHLELDRYFKWQKEAEKGFKFVPKKYLVQIKTASDMYKWTANKIKKDPFIVFRKKVKPIVPRIIYTTAKNSLFLRLSEVK
jgi:15-cis-phytoene synthase